MPSLIPGYEYDIFISYRQNDNRSGWVTEFVASLQEELASTIKDPVSVYFDTNPHDGLLETHNVDKSLEGKLKCLIFIPIISQTYCDPKGFAWEHEFLAFNKTANEDEFGREVKLRNGNITGRILPVRIHDLDVEDLRLLETEQGGVLRSIDFIYKEAGVNRPLKTEDRKEDNLNKTSYRNQINKVANAAKEIISSLKEAHGPHGPIVIKPSGAMAPEKNVSPRSRKKVALISAILLVLAIASYLIYSLDYRIVRGSTAAKKSIAVLPFGNLSGDKEQEYFSDGMMQETINQLVKIRELSVISLPSSMIYRDSKKPRSNIASELGVANILEGSVQHSGERVRITVRLIDAGTDRHLWSEVFVRDLSDIFLIQSEISKNIARELKAILSIEDVQSLSLVPTTSKEAYDYYLRSLYYERKDDWINGIEMCNRAIELDPKFTLAYVLRARWNAAHFFNKWPSWEGRAKLARADMMKAVELSPDLPEVKICQAFTYYHTERNYEKAIWILSDVQKDRPNDPQVYYWLGLVQRRQGLWREALQNMKRAVFIDPGSTEFLTQIALLQFALRSYPEAIGYAKRALSVDPEVGTAGLVIYNSLLAWKGDVASANDSIAYISSRAGLESISDSMRMEWSRHYFTRNFNELLALNEKSKEEISEDQNYYELRSLRQARIHYLMGNIDLSKQFAITALGVLKDRFKKTEEDYRIYSALGFAHAYAGNVSDAVAFGKKAVDIMPVKADAFSDGLTSEQCLAEIYIVTGKYDQALDKIEYLLSIPGNLSIPLVKIDPMYDKLRAIPRFNKVIGTEYQLNY